MLTASDVGRQLTVDPQVGLSTEEATPYREWFNLLPLIGRPVLLSLVGGPVAREWAQRSDADVKAAAISQLQRFIDAGW